MLGLTFSRQSYSEWELLKLSARNLISMSLRLGYFNVLQHKLYKKWSWNNLFYEQVEVMANQQTNHTLFIILCKEDHI